MKIKGIQPLQICSNPWQMSRISNNNNSNNNKNNVNNKFNIGNNNKDSTNDGYDKRSKMHFKK